MTISLDDPDAIIGNDKFEVADFFHYLGDSMVSQVAVLKQQQKE